MRIHLVWILRQKAIRQSIHVFVCFYCVTSNIFWRKTFSKDRHLRPNKAELSVPLVSMGNYPQTKIFMNILTTYWANEIKTQNSKLSKLAVLFFPFSSLSVLLITPFLKIEYKYIFLTENNWLSRGMSCLQTQLKKNP